jgi:hypothetical protein
MYGVRGEVLFDKLKLAKGRFDGPRRRADAMARQAAQGVCLFTTKASDQAEMSNVKLPTRRRKGRYGGRVPKGNPKVHSRRIQSPRTAW